MNLVSVFKGCLELTIRKSEKLAFESSATTQAEASLLRESIEGELESSGGEALKLKEEILDLLSSLGLCSGLLNRVLAANKGGKLTQTAQHSLVDVWTEFKTAEAVIVKIACELAQNVSQSFQSQQIEACAKCVERGLEFLRVAISKYDLGDNWLESAVGITRFLRSRPAIKNIRGSIAKALAEYA
ncbi:MAG: hypothetical protein R3A13_03505 [Bdellovibrionota bacterium]